MIKDYVFVHKAREFLLAEIDAKSLISALQDPLLILPDQAVFAIIKTKILLKDHVKLAAKIVYGEETNVYAKQDFSRLLESVLCVTQEVHTMEKIVFVILDILEIETNVNHVTQVAVNAVDLKQTNASHVLTLL